MLVWIDDDTGILDTDESDIEYAWEGQDTATVVSTTFEVSAFGSTTVEEPV